jgi:mutator protein MutT
MSGDEDSPIVRVEIAVAIVEHHGRFLIGKRPDHVALGGYWEFPGGKVEQGESPADAARRECLEETGIDVRVVGAYPIADHDYMHGALRVHFFACEVVRENAALPERFRWVSRGELGEYRFPAANDGVLSLLAQSNAKP